MIAKGIFGILAGGTGVAMAAYSFEADAAVTLVAVSPPETLMLLGLGLVGFGMWGKGKRGRQVGQRIGDFFRRFR